MATMRKPDDSNTDEINELLGLCDDYTVGEGPEITDFIIEGRTIPREVFTGVVHDVIRAAPRLRPSSEEVRDRALEHETIRIQISSVLEDASLGDAPLLASAGYFPRRQRSRLVAAYEDEMFDLVADLTRRAVEKLSRNGAFSELVQQEFEEIGVAEDCYNFNDDSSMIEELRPYFEMRRAIMAEFQRLLRQGVGVA